MNWLSKYISLIDVPNQFVWKMVTSLRLFCIPTKNFVMPLLLIGCTLQVENQLFGKRHVFTETPYLTSQQMKELELTKTVLVCLNILKN